MNTASACPASNGYGPPSSISEPYEPSISSSLSSSQASVFSGTLSSQSSIASSISDDFRAGYEDARERDRLCAQVQVRQQAQAGLLHLDTTNALAQLVQGYSLPALSYAEVTSVPPPLPQQQHPQPQPQIQRQHPRRCSLSRNQKPPTLVRQQDRKVTFVENLVDSATQMVEVIWPISVVPCKSEGSGRGVLPLRTYIEETLRRSRTSYSTLQVALYYLVLIKPSVPQHDFTTAQKTDCPADRALMCGRRMFLAALILASKYLQDRNYSAKAWSKMSGLKVSEINQNERTFLSRVNWKLHIPKPTFERWQEIVLRFTPNPGPPSPGGFFSTKSPWKAVVPLLTPELDNLPSTETQLQTNTSPSMYHGLPSPTTPIALKSALNPTLMGSVSPSSLEGTPTPTPTAAPPRFLEPKPELMPPTPALARMGPLPTPQISPWSAAASTPAVSACGSRRPSMCSAMALAQRAGLSRCTLDAHPSGIDPRCLTSRRPSVMSLASSGSSPESMFSDMSRSSRASSISSASTVSSVSSLAPQRACLARQATCRNARLPLRGLVREEEKEQVGAKTVIREDEHDVDMSASPELADFSVGEKALHAPHRHSKFAPHGGNAHVAVPGGDKGRKRCRSSGHRRSELHEEVRYLLQESLEDSMDVDDRGMTSPSSDAGTHTSTLLSNGNAARGVVTKEAQPPAHLSCLGGGRVPVQRSDGKKRTCCSSMTDRPFASSALFGEVS